MKEAFSVQSLPNGIDVHVMAATKFKTNNIVAVLHTDLDKSTATQNAVLPEVARRGTRRFPETADLARRLDSLYGMSASAGVSKTGNRQILSFGVNAANDRYLPGDEQMLRESMLTLAELVLHPAQVDGGFRPDYVEQEKVNLRRRIESIIDDKQGYAFKRCVEEMCAGERYAVHKLGSIDDIPKITPHGLWKWHEQTVRECPMDIFVIGDVDPREVFDLAAQVFDVDRMPRPLGAGEEETKSAPSTPRRIVERMDVSQGHLVMGYRTGTTLADPDFAAMMFTNGVFGGYTHSKIFQNVRERASLAYFADSSLTYNQPFMWVNAGIDFGMLDKTVDIIGRQLEDIRGGDISDSEMENTRRGILRDIEMMGDSPAAQIDFAIASLVSGVDFAPERLARAISKISKDDVVAAADKIRLDTIYFLRSGEDGANA